MIGWRTRYFYAPISYFEYRARTRPGGQTWGAGSTGGSHKTVSMCVKIQLRLEVHSKGNIEEDPGKKSFRAGGEMIIDGSTADGNHRRADKLRGSRSLGRIVPPPPPTTTTPLQSYRGYHYLAPSETWNITSFAAPRSQAILNLRTTCILPLKSITTRLTCLRRPLSPRPFSRPISVP